MTNIIVNGRQFLISSSDPVDHVVVGMTQSIGGPNYKDLSVYDPSGPNALLTDPTVTVNQWTDSVIDFDHGIWPELYASQVVALNVGDLSLLALFNIDPDVAQSTNAYTVFYSSGPDTLTIQSTDFDFGVVSRIDFTSLTSGTLTLSGGDFVIDSAGQITVANSTALLGRGSLTYLQFGTDLQPVSEAFVNVALLPPIVEMSIMERSRILANGDCSVPGADQFVLTGTGSEDISNIASVFIDTNGLANNININGRWSLPDIQNLWIDHVVIANIVPDGTTLDAVRAFDGGMNLLAEWTGPPVVGHRLPITSAIQVTSPAPGILHIEGDSLDVADRLRTQPNAFPDMSGGIDLAWDPSGPSSANNATVVGGRGCTVTSWTSSVIEIDYGVGASIPVPGVSLQSTIYAVPFQMGLCAADLTTSVLSNP